MEGKKPYVLLGFAGLCALGFLFYHLATRNSRPYDDYYNAVPTGTAVELIEKYAATCYAHAGVIEGHKATIATYEAELKKSAELLRLSVEAGRNSTALLEKGCAGAANDAAAVFAEARIEDKRKSQLVKEWEIGNQARDELLKKIEQQRPAYAQAQEILRRAKEEYQALVSNCPRGALEIEVEKVLAVERDFVNDIRAKASNRADVLAACAEYDAAHKLVVEARARSKRLNVAQEATSVAFKNYDKLSAAVIDSGTAEIEANCRLAYVAWQEALQAEKAARKEWKSHDSYSSFEERCEEAFQKVLCLAHSVLHKNENK